MNRNKHRVLDLKENLEEILDKLDNVQGKLKHKAKPCIQRCSECLKGVPDTETKVYIHIIGTDKSFKTSYLLDLFDNDELRDIFAIKSNNNSENTAVPCLVEPSAEVDAIRIRQVSILTKEVIRDDLSKKHFIRLYDLSSGAVPKDYMIQIQVPAARTPMELPVIEYPGIKEGADTLHEHRELHKAFQKDLLATLVKYPGVLVTCFQHKIAIPHGHPMDIILARYREVLRNTGTSRRLPLIISMQGSSAVAGYCGNTNVVNDIENDFQSHTFFDTLIQLVNPSNLEHPVMFGPVGHHVDSWIRKLSRYGSVNEIHEAISLDGGISWSRRLLEAVCREPGIREALDNIFLRPWIKEAQACFDQAMECYNEISTYDDVQEIRERVRLAIIDENYRPVRDCFNEELAFLGGDRIPNQGKFWVNVFARYLVQFLDDDAWCRSIAGHLWENLRSRLDSENKGFLGTREEDLPYIIMNMAELYVPNALIRGDFTLLGKDFEDTIHAV